VDVLLGGACCKIPDQNVCFAVEIGIRKLERDRDNLITDGFIVKIYLRFLCLFLSQKLDVAVKAIFLRLLVEHYDGLVHIVSSIFYELEKIEIVKFFR